MIQGFKTIMCDGAIYTVPEHIHVRCPSAANIISHCTESEPPVNAWDVIHTKLGRLVDDGKWDRDEFLKWYRDEWWPLIPSCGECRSHWKKNEKQINWKTAETAYKSLHELHNEVSEKYANRPTMTMDQCDAIYRKQPAIDWCVAVTSLSPKRQDRQTVCLDSWKQFGLKITCVQHASEIDTMRAVYPQVDRWVACEGFVPRIKELAMQAGDVPVLVMNSDIEIHGKQDVLRKAIKHGPVIGIRYNYDRYWWHNSQEMWGTDAFSFTKKDAKALPDLPLVIGKPVWDYWMLHHFNERNPQWINEPMFFHRVHKLGWTVDEWSVNSKVFTGHYSLPPVDYETSWWFRRQFPHSG